MKQPHGPTMTLGNMRHLGVQRLVATCLNDACRHQGLIDVSKYPDDTEVPSFAGKAVCVKCGAWPPHRRAAELEGTVVTPDDAALSRKFWCVVGFRDEEQGGPMFVMGITRCPSRSNR
jgi:hypothetical protein